MKGTKMEPLTMQDYMNITAEQKKAMEKQIIKNVALFITLKIGLLVAVNLSARALRKWAEKQV